MIKVFQFTTRLSFTSPFYRTTIVRSFSFQDAATALRPFFFMVHPDFFGQHPTERIVNENSLKSLNEYLASYNNKRYRPKLKEVVFYMRRGDSLSQALKVVKIPLDAKNLRETVLVILRACDLSDEHVAEESKPDYGANRPIDWHHSYYTATGKKSPYAQTPEKPAALSLRGWLSQNIEQSKTKAEAVRSIKDDIMRLLEKLKHDLCLNSIRCDSVWGLHHFRGCLKSFDRMCDNQPKFVRQVLKDRTLVFSNATGVSRRGEIILSSEDVPDYWFSSAYKKYHSIETAVLKVCNDILNRINRKQLLMKVRAYDAVLRRLPNMEEKLSSLLNGIQIVSKERRHGTIMAEEYELMLNKLINTLRRSQDHVRNAFQHSDLSLLQLVVDGEESPLMLSSSGQFFIPASIPATLVVDFIRKHQEQALSLCQHMEQLLKKERDKRQEVIRVLSLLELNKDENVTPSQMISCCSRLIEQSWTLEGCVAHSRLRISHYYSVMQDGEICLPWDWVGMED